MVKGKMTTVKKIFERPQIYPVSFIKEMLWSNKDLQLHLSKISRQIYF